MPRRLLKMAAGSGSRLHVELEMNPVIRKFHAGRRAIDDAGAHECRHILVDGLHIAADTAGDLPDRQRSLSCQRFYDRQPRRARTRCMSS